MFLFLHQRHPVTRWRWYWTGASSESNERGWWIWCISQENDACLSF